MPRHKCEWTSKQLEVNHVKKRQELTPKQQQFVLEYIIDFNGAQAAIRAGYSPKTAREIASENLTKPNIQKAIQKAIEERQERTKVKADEVVQELKRIGFADIKDYITFNENGVVIVTSEKLSKDLSTCISEISMYESEKGRKTLRFKLHDKIKALEMLGRHLGLFRDNLDLNISKETYEDRLRRIKGLEKDGK